MIAAGSRYVAIGSSFAAGPGIAPVRDPAAGRSGRNYPQLLAAELDLDLVDATYSGATTATILHDGQGDEPPQIAAVTPATELVTITAGGNDLDYVGSLVRGSKLGSLARILGKRTGQRIRDRVSYRRDDPAYDAVARALTEIVKETKQVAPRARVVLVDYLTIVGPRTRAGADLPLDDAQLAGVVSIADGLARAFATAAERSGAELVAASVASRDHALGSAEPWTTGFSLRPPRLGGPVPYHPNASGMAAVAELLARHLRGMS